MTKIIVNLPADRFESGSLHIEIVEGESIGGWSVLGRSGEAIANNPADYGITAPANPTRDPKAMLGDTPAGTYKVVAAVKSGIHATNTSLKSVKSYGSEGVVLLLGTGGDALIARQAGRTVFMIHGGDLHKSKLRPSAGCLRMSNENMEQFMTALHDLQEAKKSPTVCEIIIGEVSFIYHPVSSTQPGDENIQNEILSEPPAGLQHPAWSRMPLTDLMDNLIHTIPPPPIVNAGNNQTITLPADSITLSCHITLYDPDGSAISYKWTKVSGPAATIKSPDKAGTVVTDLTKGTYVFNVVIKDDRGNLAEDTINVIINLPPVVTAGKDKTITLPVRKITLTAKGTDPDGNKTITYQWSKVSGPAATIKSPTAESTVVTELREGNYVFKVVVKDNNNSSAQDTVVVKVNPKPPHEHADHGGDHGPHK